MLCRFAIVMTKNIIAESGNLWFAIKAKRNNGLIDCFYKLTLFAQQDVLRKPAGSDLEDVVDFVRFMPH